MPCNGIHAASRFALSRVPAVPSETGPRKTRQPLLQRQIAQIGAWRLDRRRTVCLEEFAPSVEDSIMRASEECSKR